MKYTSAEAAKLIRQLKEEHQLIRTKENKTSIFQAAVGENAEELRPSYDYGETQQALAEVERKIRKVKHAVSLFNLNTQVEGMTIDEVLVYLPQLQERRSKLSAMVDRMPKQRAKSGFMSRYTEKSAIIDYEYANYDIGKAEEDLRNVSEEIARLQTALDVANTTGELEIEL